MPATPRMPGDGGHREPAEPQFLCNARLVNIRQGGAVPRRALTLTDRALRCQIPAGWVFGALSLTSVHGVIIWQETWPAVLPSGQIFASRIAGGVAPSPRPKICVFVHERGTWGGAGWPHSRVANIWPRAANLRRRPGVPLPDDPR
jgi:hypothetical protein